MQNDVQQSNRQAADVWCIELSIRLQQPVQQQEQLSVKKFTETAQCMRSNRKLSNRKGAQARTF